MSEQQLAVLAFDNALKAQEFFTAALRLSQAGNLVISDAVFVSKDVDGTATVVETTDPGPGRSALTTGAWGLLIGAILAVPVAGLVIGATTGAITAAIVDTGVPDEFVNHVRQVIQPGKTAVALLVSHINAEAVQAELTRFAGAELITGTLAPDAVERVQAALANGTEV